MDDPTGVALLLVEQTAMRNSLSELPEVVGEAIEILPTKSSCPASEIA
jgi:hypothetical protein